MNILTKIVNLLTGQCNCTCHNYGYRSCSWCKLGGKVWW